AEPVVLEPDERGVFGFIERRECASADDGRDLLEGVPADRQIRPPPRARREIDEARFDLPLDRGIEPGLVGDPIERARRPGSIMEDRRRAITQPSEELEEDRAPPGLALGQAHLRAIERRARPRTRSPSEQERLAARAGVPSGDEDVL